MYMTLTVIINNIYYYYYYGIGYFMNKWKLLKFEKYNDIKY